MSSETTPIKDLLVSAHNIAYNLNVDLHLSRTLFGSLTDEQSMKFIKDVIASIPTSTENKQVRKLNILKSSLARAMGVIEKGENATEDEMLLAGTLLDAASEISLK